MQTLTYTIVAENGLHARPAGILAKELARFQSEISLASPSGKSASAKKLFALMGLGIKKGDTVTLCATGSDEEAAMAFLADFMKSNF